MHHPSASQSHAPLMYEDYLPGLPDEILRYIFHQASFIPGEWDASATSFQPGLFCTYDEYQIAAWGMVLPTRVSIVGVCRRWYRIGIEFLYGTFHFTRRPSKTVLFALLNAFRRCLEERPGLGKLVKRLTLSYNPEQSGDKTTILELCPNVVVFSSFLSSSTTLKWWSPTVLPPSLRQLDAKISKQEWSTMVTIINSFYHLEILHIHFDHSNPFRPRTVVALSLPALRMLHFIFWEADVLSLGWFLNHLECPRLQALSLESESILPGSLLHIPPKILNRLTSFNTWGRPISTRAEDLMNLHQVLLDVLGSIDITPLMILIPHIPFHRIIHIVFGFYSHIHDHAHCRFDLLMAFPLDVTAMPALQVVEIGWRTYRLSSMMEGNPQVLHLLDSLASKFERRGVDFIESQRDLLTGPVPIRRLVDNFRAKHL
jgi:hypothetical protein